MPQAQAFLKSLSASVLLVAGVLAVFWFIGAPISTLKMEGLFTVVFYAIAIILRDPHPLTDIAHRRMGSNLTPDERTKWFWRLEMFHLSRKIMVHWCLLAWAAVVFFTGMIEPLFGLNFVIFASMVCMMVAGFMIMRADSDEKLAEWLIAHAVQY